MSVPKYTQEQLDMALQLAVKGEKISTIIEECLLGTTWMFWRYRQEYPDFLNKFEQARQEGLENMADDLQDAHKSEVDVQRARLKSDNYKWLLSKRKPAIYGDKVDIHVSQTIDITGALADAKRRALPTPTIDVTPLSIPQKTKVE